jgi:type III restriction enzyme
MELKEYQQSVLEKFDRWLATVSDQIDTISAAAAALKAAKLSVDLGDPSEKAWDILNDERRLPHLRDQEGREMVAPYLTRRDGLTRSIPNVCLKVPTGGGKTLLATLCVERVQMDFFKRQTGFVLWVVPSDAIYRQTWKQLANREHPYRQMLERASGGRVKLLEKGDAFTKQDVDNFLCVMLLMLPSAARQSKETLRMFRDSGRFTTFFPPEDDAGLNRAMLEAVPNLDTNDIAELSYADGVTPGWCSLKQSLGNVLRVLRPVVVIDEGHKAYSPTARDTIDGFNPRFILELSATPNAGGRHSSNVLVAVPGTALKAESMIKLPINVTNEDKGGWKHTLTLAHAKLAELRKETVAFQTESGRYIRPIMLLRVERTGKDQRDGKLVHAEDAKEYLIEKLGVRPEEIRLKTSETNDLGDEDLLHATCEVRYIITKAALQEGWDCPFAYVLAILSKTTANTSLTQMIGRILRQPHATLTGRSALDECHVFTYDQDVSEAVESVRRGLQDEGMADLASQVKLTGGSAAAKRVARAETLARRKRFAKIPPIFLPRVLHRDSGKKSDHRLLDYERDILGELDWESFRYSGAETFPLPGDGKNQRTKARIDVKRTGDKQEVVQELFQESSDEMPEEGLDLPFLVRQLLDVVPNPWQGMRIFEEALATLRKRGADAQQLYACRFDLLKELKLDLKRQTNKTAEVLFKDKLKDGCISFRLVSSDDPELNWKLAETLVIDVSEEDRELRRKNGDPLDKSLFEPIYQRDFNTLEKDTAWYLDGSDTVYWWHRIAVNQSSYGLQGWQKNRVYPDFLACIHGVENGKFRFSVLETKGEHLKGNEDTEYKQKFFDFLTAHASTAIRAGELRLGVESEEMNFTMLLEDSWREKLGNAVLGSKDSKGKAKPTETGEK